MQFLSVPDRIELRQYTRQNGVLTTHLSRDNTEEDDEQKMAVQDFISARPFIAMTPRWVGKRAANEAQAYERTSSRGDSAAAIAETSRQT